MWSHDTRLDTAMRPCVLLVVHTTTRLAVAPVMWSHVESCAHDSLSSISTPSRHVDGLRTVVSCVARRAAPEALSIAKCMIMHPTEYPAGAPICDLGPPLEACPSRVLGPWIVPTVPILLSQSRIHDPVRLRTRATVPRSLDLGRRRD